MIFIENNNCITSLSHGDVLYMLVNPTFIREDVAFGAIILSNRFNSDPKRPTPIAIYPLEPTRKYTKKLSDAFAELSEKIASNCDSGKILLTHSYQFESFDEYKEFMKGLNPENTNESNLIENATFELYKNSSNP